MADETEPTDQTETTTETTATDRGGVQLPTWLAGALVVVLALTIGGVGYAIGDDGSGVPPLEPIAEVRGAPDGDSNVGPSGPGARGADCMPFPGGPGGGPGGRGGPGGLRPEGLRGVPDAAPDGESDAPDDDAPDDAPDEQGNLLGF